MRLGLKLFEVRFSLRAQQLQQRFPKVTRSLLSRVLSGVLASGALCIANDYVPDRTFSLDSTPSRIGSSAWFLSCMLWVCLLRAGAHWGKSCAGSVRFSRCTSSCTPRAFVSGSPLSVCVEPKRLFLFFLFHFSLNLSIDVISLNLVCLKKNNHTTPHHLQKFHSEVAFVSPTLDL